jgi:hypothetical protein
VTRRIEVGVARLDRWCAGFLERHGDTGLPAVRNGDALLLTAADGATARLVVGFPPPVELADLAGFVGWAGRPRRSAVLLVRRGGYACAAVDTGLTGSAAVTASKVGTRYVQSRTAAGGWSQQRFARRRDNQARELAAAAADVTVRLLLPWPAEWLVTGGDRPLVDAVLADPRLAALRRLPHGPHLAIGDPRSDLVRSLPERLTTVIVELTEPDAG